MGTGWPRCQRPGSGRGLAWAHSAGCRRAGARRSRPAAAAAVVSEAVLSAVAVRAPPGAPPEAPAASWSLGELSELAEVPCQKPASSQGLALVLASPSRLSAQQLGPESL